MVNSWMRKRSPSPQEMQQEWLMVKEAAAYIKIGETRLRQETNDRKIKHTRLTDGGIRFKRQWLDDYMESMAVEVVDLSMTVTDMLHSSKRKKFLHAAGK